MRPRSDTIIRGSQTTVVDLTAGLPPNAAKAESKADARALMWQKIRAALPAGDDTDGLLLLLLRLVVLIDKRANENLTPTEAAFMTSMRMTLARVNALCQAAEAIEMKIEGFTSADAVFGHNERLKADPIWPE